MKRFVCAAALVAVAVPAFADVTITSRTSGKGMGAGASGQSVMFIKGTKMRTDQTVGGEATSTIIDADALKMIILRHAKKEAQVHDMQQMAGELQKMGGGDILVDMKPTGNTRQVAGQSCADYQVSVTVPFSPVPNEKMSMVMSGPVCLSKTVPGQSDFSAFYKAAAEKGLFFGDPRTVKAQPAQTRALAAMYRAMAEGGVSLASDLQMRFEGSGMMAQMMNKMGGMGFSSEATAISGEAIGADTFAVPAGYQTK